METGSNMESGKSAASASSAGGEAMTTSPPVPEPVAAGEDEVAAPAAGAGSEASAPAAAASPKPYYECVFCKRGFTTAQALGGHMNIHRRDRAKPTTTTTARDYSPLPSGITTVSRNVECYNKYRHLLGSYTTTPAAAAQSSSSSIPIPIVGVAGSSFGMYYTSSSGALPAAGARLDAEAGNPNSVIISPRELSLFGDQQQDLHLGLGRHGHIVGGEGSRALGEGSSERQEPGETPERELDLELRLGRCPSRH